MERLSRIRRLERLGEIKQMQEIDEELEKETKLFKAAFDLVASINKLTDKSLPREIADIVKFHSKGAAVAALGSAWIPGVGGTVAVTVSGGFVWSMYARINSKIKVPISEKILKTLASGITTKIIAGIIAMLAFSTVLSFIPGVGNIGASAIMGGTCYALTLVSGFIYLKILAKIFRDGKNPSSLSADELKDTVDTIIQNENIKEVIKEAKKAYKTARERGEIKKENADSTKEELTPEKVIEIDRKELVNAN